MRNIYYLIWSDIIQRFWIHHPQKAWKWTLFSFITWIHALNLFIVALWLKYFDVYTAPNLHINIFPGELLDGFTNFAITFAGPFAVINYFLIFFRDRYEKIVERYKMTKTEYGFIYCLSILAGALLSGYLYGILNYFKS